MTTTFLLIRHAHYGKIGQLLSGRQPGHSLSTEGHAQAARLGAALAPEAIDGVVSSPLERTRETAAAIRHDVAIEDALIELDYGDWTGREIANLAGDPAFAEWNDARGTAGIPGGETMRGAQARIVACLDRLAAEGAGRTIAVVSHADMIRAVVAHVIGLPLDHLLRFDVAPASVTRVVWGDWGARLMSLNEKVLDGDTCR